MYLYFYLSIVSRMSLLEKVNLEDTSKLLVITYGDWNKYSALLITLPLS